VITVVLALAIVVFLWWVARQAELFVVSIRAGQLIVVRGRVPGTLLADIRTIVTQPPVRHATVTATKREHGARLSFSGDLDDAQQQRLRNVFGLYPLSRLRQAPPLAKPTLGQVLGIAWLAWWLDRRL
jgi:hypothetical protein